MTRKKTNVASVSTWTHMILVFSPALDLRLSIHDRPPLGRGNQTFTGGGSWVLGRSGRMDMAAPESARPGPRWSDLPIGQSSGCKTVDSKDLFLRLCKFDVIWKKSPCRCS